MQAITKDRRAVDQEKARLAALADLQISDTGPEEMFDRIARLAKESLRFPWSYISFIELERQTIKTQTGGAFLDGCRTTAFCSSTIDTDKPLIIPDALASPRFSDFPQVVGPPHVRAYWGVPLTTTSGFNIGALSVLDNVPRIPTPEDIALLSEFGRLTVECMELRAQATTDILTGVHSRRAFLARAKQMFADARAQRRELSFTIFDLDHFKRINDTFGHLTGDRVLKSLGMLLLRQLEPNVLVGRMGGEEFAIASLDQVLSHAIAAAEAIRCRIADHLGQIVPGCTASFGVAALSGEDGTLDRLVHRADAAVYAAKAAGRNCTRPAVQAPSIIPEIEVKIDRLSGR